jgi:hypothetical protein
MFLRVRFILVVECFILAYEAFLCSIYSYHCPLEDQVLEKVGINFTSHVCVEYAFSRTF